VRDVWQLLVAALGYGTIGAACKSSSPPVAGTCNRRSPGVPAEAILSSLWTSGQDWLPGQLLSNLSSAQRIGCPLTERSYTLLASALWRSDAALFSRRMSPLQSFRCIIDGGGPSDDRINPVPP